MKYEQQKFIDDAREIAKTKGKSRNGWNNACISTGERSFEDSYDYEDETVYISSSKASLALFVKMKLPHTNPVLCVNQDGEAYRFHGEYYLLENHFESLLA